MITITSIPLGHRLRGERTGKQYRLGDEVHVKVARVNLDDRKIDFALPDSVKETPQQRPRDDKPGSKKKRGGKSRNKRRSRRKS